MLKKVKIKSWEQLKNEFRSSSDYDYDKCIYTDLTFTKNMYNLLPKDRIIEVEDSKNVLYWKKEGYYLSRQVVESHETQVVESHETQVVEGEVDPSHTISSQSIRAKLKSWDVVVREVKSGKIPELESIDKNLFNNLPKSRIVILTPYKDASIY